MEEPRKEYSEDDSLDKSRTAAEYGNEPHRRSGDNSANKTFGREETLSDKGSKYLIDHYNINDQAHSDSSLDDFVRTTSAFRHANEGSPDTDFNQNPGGVSTAD